MRIATQEMFGKNNNLYRINEQALQKATERLSTGLRINRAADDAAGLMVSERLKSQVNGLSVSKNNLGYATDMLSTAEAGLGKVGELLQNIRTLSIEAQNGTYTTEQKQTIQEQVNAYLKEIDHLSQNTSYNGLTVLNRDGGVYFGGDIDNVRTVITVPDASFIPTTANQPRTYDMLVQVDGLNFSASNLLHARLFQTHTGYLSIYGPSGNIHLRSDAGVVQSFGVQMPIGEKTRLTVTYDGSLATLYLNGEEKSTINVIGMTSVQDFFIGNTGGNASEGIIGTFYEANYYKKELSENEIQALYDGSNVPGAEASWNFEESDGSIVKDNSGNGNDGNIIGNIVRNTSGVRVHSGYGATDSIDLSLTSVSVSDLGLDSLDITNKDSLNKLDHSINYVANKRATLGAEMNRLSFNKDKVENDTINHSDALNRIQSLDYARESSKLTKDSILQQSIAAMFVKAKDFYQSSAQLLQS